MIGSTVKQDRIPALLDRLVASEPDLPASP
jgi:hypothetical protein